MVELNCRYVIAPLEPLRVELLFSHDPISFFGGVNAVQGSVQDYRHGNYQSCMTGKAFAFPFGKGSSGAGLVLMEMVRLKTAPAAIINLRTDPVILTGPLLCRHFYNQILPIVNVSEEDYAQLESMQSVELFPTGTKMKAFDPE